MEEKTKRGPLLYISQAFSGAPANNMQEVFMSKQQIELPVEEQQPMEEKTKRKGFEVSLVKAELPDVAKKKKPEDAAVQKKDDKQHRHSFSKVKSFKEMNVSERLDYLMNFPKSLPPVPCVFFTEEKNYQGYLISYKENEVTIQIPNQASITIPADEITNVIMIGIKR
jgi:hypothetical protein